MRVKNIFSHNDLNFISQFSFPEIVNQGDYNNKKKACGFIGRDTINDREPVTIVGDIKPGNGSGRFKVISFHTTDEYYTSYAKRLEKSLIKYNVDYVISAIESNGDWENNCAYKADYIYKIWQESDVPVVWLDADATLERKPELFSSLNADFAIHKWTWDIENTDSGWQFASGTLYFGKTDLAGKLLKQWVLRCHSDPFTWDQEHLSSAWCDINCLHPLKTFFLAREYLQIDGATEFSPPVIKHWQASRLLKKRNESVFHEVLKITDEGKFNRQINCLWRTPEELFWIDEGVSNIIPNTKFEYPEGDYLKDMLFDAIEGSFPVLEIGCGIGRIAKLFDADKYIGVDVNPNALVKARNVLPTHYFRIHDKGCCYPKATSVLLYTVLLHISDSVIYDFLKEVCNNKTKIVISELMDTRWRRGGNPPVYNRDPEDYILLMSELGFKLMKSIKREYERYNRSPWNIGRDSRITTLVFENNR